MTDRLAEISPQRYARLGGAFYLIIIAMGIFGQLVVRGSLVVPEDAAATAANIAASPTLWRLGIAGDLIMQSSDVPLMLIFYVLLRPVSQPLAMLVVLFNLVQTSVLVANKLNLVTPLLLLGGAPTEQLQAIRMHDFGFGVGLIFFGFECVVLGHLIRKSGYFPSVLGVLMQIAGAAYLLNSFSMIVAPSFSSAISPGIFLPIIVAEGAFAVWLLVKGVDLAKWAERVARS